MKECPYCGLEIVGEDDVHEHCDAEYQEEYSSYRDMMTNWNSEVQNDCS